MSLGENHTVILSRPHSVEVRAVCDEIMIISKGRLKAVDTPENLEKLFAGQSAVEIVVKAGPEEANVRSYIKSRALPSSSARI
jgi:ABC-2 type transport system ATP-binding protein